MEVNNIIAFTVGLNAGLALMLFMVLYYIDKYHQAKKQYEDLRRNALSEIAKLRKEISKCEKQEVLKCK